MVQILFVPGLLCTGEVFAPQIEALGEGHEISIADHTGHDSIAALARAILAAAPERFVLVGLSLGGIIALEIMAQQPKRVMGLVLIDTSGRADTPEQAGRRIGFIEFAEQNGLRHAMEKSLPLMLHEARQNDARLRELLFGMAEATGLDVFKRQQSALAARASYLDQLPSMSAPCLVIVGEADAMTPPDLGQELATGIPGAEFEMIAGCGHLSTLECPEFVSRLIASFLARNALDA